MNKHDYSLIGETLYHEQLDNGLNVYLLPKNDFHKTYGIFATPYGSIHRHIKTNGEDLVFNAGIEHFLEHKMFEKKAYSVDELFTKHGASCNAFTSFSKTAYLFSATSHVEENTKILLDFVQNIELTEESVEKEKGIIIQELKMYQDDADSRIFYDLLENLYLKHPIKDEILGSEASIQTMTKKQLEQCYHHFYHPSQMTLFIVGKMDVDHLMVTIRENQSQKTFNQLSFESVLLDDEPKEVAVKEKVLHMPISNTKFVMGFKLNPIKSLKDEFIMMLLLNTLFAKSTDLYQTWLSKGLINQSFYADVIVEPGMSFVQIGSDSDHYNLFQEALHQLIDELSLKQLDLDRFINHKRLLIAEVISSFNYLEGIGQLFIMYEFQHESLFEVSELIDSITFESLDDAIQTLKNATRTTLVIKPE